MILESHLTLTWEKMEPVSSSVESGYLTECLLSQAQWEALRN